MEPTFWIRNRKGAGILSELVGDWIPRSFAALYTANRGTRPRARLSVQSSDGPRTNVSLISVANIVETETSP